MSEDNEKPAAKKPVGFAFHGSLSHSVGPKPMRLSEAILRVMTGGSKKPSNSLLKEDQK